MIDGDDTGARADHAVVPDMHRGNIQNGDIVISKKTVSNVDVETIVTVEAGTGPGIFSAGAKQLFELCGNGILILRINGVQPGGLHHGMLFPGVDLFVPEGILKSGFQLLKFGHMQFHLTHPDGQQRREAVQ